MDKASHLTAFCAWDCSPHLLVTPAHLMRPGLALFWGGDVVHQLFMHCTIKCNGSTILHLPCRCAARCSHWAVSGRQMGAADCSQPLCGIPHHETSRSRNEGKRCAKIPGIRLRGVGWSNYLNYTCQVMWIFLFSFDNAAQLRQDWWLKYQCSHQNFIGSGRYLRFGGGAQMMVRA